MDTMVSPVGGVGTPAQLAMMEFPLFPVFLSAAVQTLPVPWGWAGLGSQAVYPSPTWQALTENRAFRHDVLCLHWEKSDQSLFVQHFFTFSSGLLSVVFLCQEQTCWDFTNGSPIKYDWFCLYCFSVS